MARDRSDDETIRVPETPSVEPRAVEDDAPSRVGRYEIHATLGEGGMGVVYRAHDSELDRDVALKCLRTNVVGGTDADSVGRFLREARALAQLSHPNVVPIFDVQSHGTRIYLAMELVEGETLGRWVKAHPDWREILDVFTDAGRGLVAAHEAGLVHRDFKPSNVLVGVDPHAAHGWRARVLDFGLARAAGDASSAGESASRSDPERAFSSGDEHSSGSAQKLTQTGMVLGTPRYMAPEQNTGGTVGPAADQYAFCTALFEAIYRQRPFNAATPRGLLDAKRTGRPAAVDMSLAPRWLHDVVLRGLAPDPKDRWPSMRELLSALDRRGRGRWRLGAAAVVVLGSGIAATAGALRSFAEDRDCADETRAEAAWSEPRRAEIRTAIEALGPAVAQAWPGIEAGIDAYVADLGTALRRACEHGDAADSPAVAHCLERRALHLEGVVSSLHDPSPPVVWKVQRAVKRLPSIDGCTSEDPEDALVPSDPALAVEVARLREELARLQGLVAVHERECGPVAAALESAAAAVDFPPLLARVRHVQAACEALRGNYADAAAHFERAHLLANEHGLDRLATEAAIGVSTTMTDRLGRTDDGERWAKTAAASMARVRDPDLLRPRVLVAEGVVLQERARFDEAETRIREALAAAEALDPHRPDLVADLTQNLAVVLDLAGKHAEAEEVYRRALQMFIAEEGESSPSVVQTLGSLAAAVADQGRLREQLEILQRALDLAGPAFGPEHPMRAELLNNLAAAHGMLRDNDEACEYAAQALALYRKTLGDDHPSTANGWNSMGRCHERRAELDEALRCYDHVVAILEGAHGPEHPNLAKAFINIGTIHQRAKRWDASERAFERSRRIHQVVFGKGSHLDWWTLASLAVMHREQGKLAQAEAELREAVAGLDGKAPDPVLTAIAKFDLAKLLRLAGKDPEEARALAEAALPIFERHEEAAYVEAVRTFLK